jgi:hypothetical protein
MNSMKMPIVKDNVCLMPVVSDVDGRCLPASMGVPSLASTSPAGTWRPAKLYPIKSICNAAVSPSILDYIIISDSIE